MPGLPVAVSVLKALETFEKPSQVSSSLQEGRRQIDQLAETLFPNDADKNLVLVRCKVMETAFFDQLQYCFAVMRVAT